MDIHIDLTNMFNLIMPHFRPLLYDKNFYLVLRGGAGSGKSVFCVLKIIIRILIGYQTDVKHNFLVIMKEASSMDDTVIYEFRKWLEYFNILGTICIEKKAPHQFIFDNGSRIFFKGCDDPNKLLSLSGVTGIWLEEVSRIPFSSFMIVDTRLRGKFKTYKQIMMSFNPTSKLSWLYDYFYVNIKHNATLHKSVVKDNYLLKDDQYKARIKGYKDININLYNVYWLGEWGSLEGIIYDNNWDVVDSIPENPHEVVYGLDFGTTAPSALVRVVEYDDEFWLEEKIYKTGMITADIIEEMKVKIPKNEQNCNIYCDSAEKDRIEEIYRAGFYSDKSIKDVIAGINFCKSKKLHIHKDSVNLIKELESYSWEVDKEGIQREKPAKINDHACDAVRYSIYTHFKDKIDYNLVIP